MVNRTLWLVIIGAAALGAAGSADWITSLGGKVERNPAGKIVAVNLRGSWINDLEMLEVAELPDIERLDLSHTRITDEGLLRLKPARKITDLNLFYAESITDQGLTAIRDWKQLRRLNLRGTRISDGTLEVIGRLTGLEALDIAHTSVTDNGLDYLITLVNLKELALGRGRLSNASWQMLRMLPTLTHLDLSGERPAPPDMGGRATARESLPEGSLRAIADLKELRVLKLGYSSITADGLRLLASLDKLEKLGLEGCRRVDDNAVAELANWKSLKYLDLQDTPATENAVNALRKARPELRILFRASGQDFR
jgi:Leucine-rich repeat (LRR) protein